MYTSLIISNAIGQSVNNYSSSWIPTVSNIIVGIVTGCISSLMITIPFRLRDIKKEHSENCSLAAKYLINLSIFLDQAIDKNSLESYRNFQNIFLETRIPPLKNKWIKDSFTKDVADILYSERLLIINKLNEILFALKQKEDKVYYLNNKESVDNIITNVPKVLEECANNLTILSSRLSLRKITCELNGRKDRSDNMNEVRFCLKRIKKLYSQNRNDCYDAIYEEISKYSSREKDNLEIILRCEKGTAERLFTFKGIIPIFFSIISTIISVGSSYVIALLNREDVSFASITQSIIVIIINIAVVSVVALLLYLGLDIISGRSITKSTYLLGVLENVMANDKKENNA